MSILRHRPRVFVCYRHSDTPAHARWLHRELEERWGADHVFIDDAIRPGSEFPAELERRIIESTFLLVVIGRGWLGGDPSASPRIFHADDWVRREIVTALTHDKDVVPVLVEGAVMPSASELPEEVRGLTSRQAHRLSDSGWRRDVGALATHLERAMPPSPSPWIGWGEWRGGTYDLPTRAVIGRVLADPWVLLAGAVTVGITIATRQAIVLSIGVVASVVLAVITTFDRKVIRGIDAKRSLRGRSRS